MIDFLRNVKGIIEVQLHSDNIGISIGHIPVIYFRFNICAL
jgi:hypothetical protein